MESVDLPGGGEPSAALALSPPDERPAHPRHLSVVPPAVADAAARDRHPSAGLSRHLDTYLAAVGDALAAHGVIAGPPLRSDPSSHLVASIVVDCTAASSVVEHEPARSGHPVPVVLAWDEDHGWVVGLHVDDVRSSRRLVHPDLLPPSVVVAEFVVELARRHPPGDDAAARATGSGPRRLRLLGGG